MDQHRNCSGGGGSSCRKRIQWAHTYQDIISTGNLLDAWREFLNGKRARKDVREFETNLIDNIISLHADLQNGTYQHGGYIRFAIADPKPRIIHKAIVRDRLLHHALHRHLYPFFDNTFIFDSYSCRNGKGIHKALNRFKDFAQKVGGNNTRTAWVLKCDIRKFFASIRHDKLLNILEGRISDTNTCSLLRKIIFSFEVTPKTGLPLGNLTSQLFANVYMNEFDQFVKHRLRAKYYIRYADDFVFLSEDRKYLESLIPQLNEFLETNLGLTMHPDKVYIKSFASGVDFLGWVHFPDHRVLRTVSKRRMFTKLKNNTSKERLSSYFGLLSHGHTRKLVTRISSLS